MSATGPPPTTTKYGSIAVSDSGSAVESCSSGSSSCHITTITAASASSARQPALLEFVAPEVNVVLQIVQGVVTATLLVSILVASFVVMLRTRTGLNLENVEDVVLFVRHGERHPLIPVPAMGNFSIGELTPLGEAQMTQLGSALSQQYAAFVNNGVQGRIVAADEQRCIVSAQLIMQSMQVSYATSVIPYMQISPTDPDYQEFLEREATFSAAVPPCIREAARKVTDELNVTLPDEAKLLFGVLIIDSLDMVRAKGLPLPYGLDQMSCLDSVGPLLSQPLYDALNELAMSTFCKPAFRTFVDEVREFRQNAGRSLVTFSLSDVHVSGLLALIDGSRRMTRPGFGAHIVIHFYPNTLDIYYSPTYDQQASPWLSNQNTDKLLERIAQAVY